jgi:hypothetical protein
MLYRIAIKTYNGSLYYLTSDEDAPETDAKVNFEEIQFLSKLNPTHAHTFSSEELAKEVCENLPYPYNEKSTLMETPSKESIPTVKLYYRICKKVLNKLNHINNNKKFTELIEPETASFTRLEDAEEFLNSLPKFTQKTAFIAEVHDFGPPDYVFKNYFITKTGEKTEKFPLD